MIVLVNLELAPRWKYSQFDWFTALFRTRYTQHFDFGGTSLPGTMPSPQAFMVPKNCSIPVLNAKELVLGTRRP